MINPEKLRSRLIHEGLKETKNLEDYYLINKHIDRFLESFRFLRSNGLPETSFMLSKLYRADVVIRQEMSKVLMPIELSIVTKLQYYIEENNITFYQLIDSSIFEDLSNIPRSTWKKRKRNNLFVINTLLGLSNKWQTANIKFLIFQMTFGQIAAIIKALENTASQYIMNVNKIVSTVSLENIVNVRNYIAHLGQLFINKDLQITHKLTLPLPVLVNHIAVTAYGKYADNLKKILICYKDRVINSTSITKQQKSELSKLFIVIQVKLFGV